MSKGNLFMGYGRGKVGSVVLARSKGQQVTRAYNDAPKNPRSSKQMMQRSIFASAVKFFAQGRQAFFKFAFENKATKESDYNAFMSFNAKRGQYISKLAYEENTYPVLAPYKMTAGGLSELPLDMNEGETAFNMPLSGVTASSTWGDVSQKLIDLYGLLSGDIITLCVISAPGNTATNCPSITPDKGERITWDITQAKLDIASTETVASVLGSTASVIADNIVVTPAVMTTAICGACLTVSRVTTEGTKVGDSFLALNAIAQEVYEASQEESYINDVLESWKATGEAILQGSLVQ